MLEGVRFPVLALSKYFPLILEIFHEHFAHQTPRLHAY
jgi:hypothetical protein